MVREQALNTGVRDRRIHNDMPARCSDGHCDERKRTGTLLKALRSLIKQQVNKNARFGPGQCTNPGPDLKTASPVGVNSMSAVVSENTSIPHG